MTNNKIRQSKFSVTISKQLTVNIILFIIVITLSTYFLLKHTNEELKLFNEELQGLGTNHRLLQLLIDLTEHSILKLQYDYGTQDTKEELDQKTSEIETKISALFNEYAKLNPSTPKLGDTVKEQWHKIINDKFDNINDYEKLYIPLLKEIKEAINYVGLSSKLTLNTEINLYYLSYAILYTIPYNFELSTLITHNMYPLYIQKTPLDSAHKQKLIINTNFLEKLSHKVYKELNTVMYNDLSPEVRDNLSKDMIKYHNALSVFLKYTNQSLTDTSNIKAEVFLMSYYDVKQASYNLYIASISALQELLSNKLKSRKQIFFRILFSNIAILIFGIISYQVIKYNIIKPMSNLHHVMLNLADNNLNTYVPYQNKYNEIGDMARALELFKQTAIKVEQMASTQYKESVEKEKRNQLLKEQINNFDHRVSKILEIFSFAISKLIEKVNTVSNSANISSQNANEVDHISKTVIQNVSIVESSTDYLISLISEMSNHIGSSNTTVHTAVKSSNEADNIIKKLEENGRKIGNVVNIIYSITHKINLLALNATIESAKAGKSGKGFAVVASEVKNLAKQASQSTDEIAGYIREIQLISTEVINTLEYISNAINDIKQVYASLTDNLDHQNSATTDIAHIMQLASGDVQKLGNNIEVLNNTANDTNHCSKELLEVLQDLINQSAQLKTEIIDFLASMRH
ncbi:Methyl-accepting chemotaxis protein [Rickettsiales bacterium Ac37b]|nr:Methyl-accepting chemotaxis protein [Rickettsiales bacterium Ac37b]